MKKASVVILILYLSIILMGTATAKDADWVQAKWHGPGGVVYLHTEGHLITSWNGNSYFPMN